MPLHPANTCTQPPSTPMLGCCLLLVSLSLSLSLAPSLLLYNHAKQVRRRRFFWKKESHKKPQRNQTHGCNKELLSNTTFVRLHCLHINKPLHLRPSALHFFIVTKPHRTGRHQLPLSKSIEPLQLTTHPSNITTEENKNINENSPSTESTPLIPRFT